MTDNVDLEFLAQQFRRMLEEQRALREVVADIRSLILHTIDFTRRVDRRLAEQRDDLALMIKAQISGGLGQFQNELDTQLQPIRDRLLNLDKPL